MIYIYIYTYIRIPICCFTGSELDLVIGHLQSMFTSHFGITGVWSELPGLPDHVCGDPKAELLNK